MARERPEDGCRIRPERNSPIDPGEGKADSRIPDTVEARRIRRMQRRKAMQKPSPLESTSPSVCADISLKGRLSWHYPGRHNIRVRMVARQQERSRRWTL